MRPAVSPLAGVPPATRVPFYSPLGDPHAPCATEAAQIARSCPVRPDFTAATSHRCGPVPQRRPTARQGLAQKAGAGCPALVPLQRCRSEWPDLPWPDLPRPDLPWSDVRWPDLHDPGPEPLGGTTLCTWSTAI